MVPRHGPGGGNGKRSGHAVHRRGAAAVSVAVGMTVLLGFSALVIDMGMLYNTRAELQRAADAAALSAASRLPGPNGMTAARQAAIDTCGTNRVLGAAVGLAEQDVVFGRAALSEATGKYTFTETQLFPNAVRVRLRRTANSPSGSVPLIFAKIFGKNTADVSARAGAVLTPRDISFVLDLSSSHNDDSSLRAHKKINIQNREVWEHLKDPDALNPKTDTLGFTTQVSVTGNGNGTSKISIQVTSDGSNKTSALSHVTFGLPQGAWASAGATATSSGGYPVEVGTDPTTGLGGVKFDETTLGENGQVQTQTFEFSVPDEYLTEMVIGTKAGKGADTSSTYQLAPGPLLGNMNRWGSAVTGPSWNCTSDPGLVYLPRSNKWTTVSSDYVNQKIMAGGYAGYNAAEMTAILDKAKSYDGTTSDYRRRVAVALGLLRWKSGKPGGQAGGDGDDRIEANEVETLVPYPDDASNPATASKEVGGSWDAYIDYVTKSNSSMCTYNGRDYFGDSDLRYRYGLKTWIDYLQEDQEGDSQSPGLAGVPSQPMGAVSDAVKTCLDIIKDLDGDDQVGMASYGTYGYGPQEKPNHMSWLVDDVEVIRERVGLLQPGMWTSNTNIAQGIDKGVGVLFNSPEARANAAKVMLLLTDGIANTTRSGYSSTSQAAADTKTAASEARARGVQIYTISVGALADYTLMEEVAAIGGGEHKHAEGDIESYEQGLKDIFEDLGGKRPVILFE